MAETAEFLILLLISIVGVMGTIVLAYWLLDGFNDRPGVRRRDRDPRGRW